MLQCRQNHDQHPLYPPPFHRPPLSSRIQKTLTFSLSKNSYLRTFLYIIHPDTAHMRNLSSQNVSSHRPTTVNDTSQPSSYFLVDFIECSLALTRKRGQYTTGEKTKNKYRITASDKANHTHKNITDSNTATFAACERLSLFHTSLILSSLPLSLTHDSCYKMNRYSNATIRPHPPPNRYHYLPQR